MSQYDSFAAEFEEHAEDSPYNAYYDRPAMFELIGDVAGQRVLDVGCGPGFYAAELIARSAHVTAFDQSAEMICLAERRLGRGAVLKVHDVDQPLDWAPDATFDTAIMALVLHHLEHPDQALQEIARVLTAAGRLIVSTVHPTFDWRNLGGSYFADESIEETWRGSWRVRYRRKPLGEWCAIFSEAGFVIDRLVEPSPTIGMQQRYPDDYARLVNEPGFIAFSSRSASPPSACVHAAGGCAWV